MKDPVFPVLIISVTLHQLMFDSLNYALLLFPSESCGSEQGIARWALVHAHSYVCVHSYDSLLELRSVEEAIQRCTHRSALC